MIYRVKKVYKGHVSAREYDIDKCIEKGENFVFQFDNAVMTLSPEQLKNKTYLCTRDFTSKGQNCDAYRLVDYPWNPDKQ